MFFLQLFNGDEKQLDLLLSTVLQMVTTTLKCTDESINAHKFEFLMEPLTDQVHPFFLPINLYVYNFLKFFLPFYNCWFDAAGEYTWRRRSIQKEDYRIFGTLHRPIYRGITWWHYLVGAKQTDSMQTPNSRATYGKRCFLCLHLFWEWKRRENKLTNEYFCRWC